MRGEEMKDWARADGSDVEKSSGGRKDRIRAKEYENRVWRWLGVRACMNLQARDDGAEPICRMK